MPYRLVVVDSNDDSLDLITRAADWNALGFQIAATFSNKEKTIPYIKSKLVDAIILSAELPGNAAIEIAAFASQNLPGCSVVMMGEHKDYDLMEKAMQCGVCDYILKPVEAEELRSRLTMLKGRIDRAKQLLRISRRQASERSRRQGKEYSSSAMLVRQAMSYVDKHILDGVSLDAVSEQMHISSSHLIRVFKKETGYTYLEYVTKKKMEKAADFLVKENLKVYEVSTKLGFRSTRHFATLFLKHFGCYPSKYAESLGDR